MRRENIMYYVMLAPALIIYLWFYVWPIIRGVSFSFYKWSGVSPKMEFVGLKNYIHLFSDARFIHAFINTLILTFGSLTLYFVLGFTFAWFAVKYKNIGRIFLSVALFPIIISPVAVGIMWSWIYDPEIGLVNCILRGIGLSFLAREWLTDPNIVMLPIILAYIWHGIGLYTVLFAVGLENIPQSIYDSLKIDGLSDLQSIIHVILPMMKEVIIVAIILCVTASFKTFDLIWTLTGGGPAFASEVVALYLYHVAFSYWRAGYSCTIAVSLLIVGLLLVLIQLKILKAKM